MQVSYKKALEVFDRFNMGIAAPGLHPYYAVADARRNNALIPVFFVFEDSGDLFYHAFHIAKIKGTGCIDIQSPYGYGGPLASSKDPEFLSKAWSAYSAWTARNNVLAEFIRFHPLLDNWRYYIGEIIEDRPTVWVDLTVDEPWSHFSPRARTAVRKAMKNGLQVEWCHTGDFVKIFTGLYFSTMTELRADRFYLFPTPYFEALLAWSCTRPAICRVDDEVVAAAIFLAGNSIMEYHLSASTAAGKKLGAGNLLLNSAVSMGKQTGCRALHLGGGTDNSTENALFFFKAGFSANRATYRIGYKIHLAAQYEQMRKEWYSIYGSTPNRILFYR